MDQSQSYGTLSLLFSNVPVTCRDECLKDWVEARGYRVSSVKLIQDLVSGTSPSFAYVHLMSAASLEEATRRLNGQILDGRRILVERIVSRAMAIQIY